MPRTAKSGKAQRHNPLHVELLEDETRDKYGVLSQPGRRSKGKQRQTVNEEEVEDLVLNKKESQRVLDLAKDQQHEEDTDEGPSSASERQQEDMPQFQGFRDMAEDDDDENLEAEGDDIEDADAYDSLNIDSGDLAAIDAMRPANNEQRKTLADLIFSKLEEADAKGTNVIRKTKQTGDAPNPAAGLNPKVVEVYSKIGFLLQKGKYKSGPLPKAFKIIPSLPAWARIMALTHPERWSPQATRAATRIFISIMTVPQARIYLEGVVLDAVRDDIRENNKLNVHYYETLIKSLYKPAAFFKGILFPLLETACSLKEAAIIASVLAKVKVPMIHSSAALLRIANMDYSGPNSLFIRVLIDKKYALPYKVVDALVFHFIRLSNISKSKPGESGRLPVLWHQSLLVFVQRYAADLTPDQKDALLDVARVTSHPQISPEVRREIVNSGTRGEEGKVPVDGDVEMG